MESNEELYRKFLNGDEDCLTKLMDRLGDPLTFYVFGYLKNIEDAEDIMIEAFSYLVVKKPHIYDNGLKSYLYKTARHMALRTKEKRRKEFTTDEFDNAFDENALVDFIVISKENNNQLYHMIEQLSVDYKEAIYLVYFQGMSHKEAAKVMKKREKQVSDLIYRARKSLKTKLEKEGVTGA